VLRFLAGKQAEVFSIYQLIHNLSSPH